MRPDHRDMHSRLTWALCLAAALFGPLGCTKTGGGGSSSSGGCTAGNLGCTCNGDNTCNSPGRCVSGTCQAPPPGALGGSCGSSGGCDVDAVWGRLQCVASTCQPGQCVAGSLGCACGPGGACQAYGVERATCSDATCILASCSAERAGQAGCACRNGSCQGTAQCIHGACRDNTVAGVKVLAPAARSCDVLLRGEGDARIRDVRFAAGVQGKDIQRGQDVALAFIATQDAPMEGRAATVDVFPAPMAGGSGLTVVRATCADKDGVPLQGIVVRAE